MKIIIDGYNLLHRLSHGFSLDVQEAREMLIERLRIYKRAKRAAITVVFDGTDNPHLAARDYSDKGIKVIFTGRGVTADEEICAMVASQGTGTVVISSDRAVADAVERSGAVSVTADDFALKLDNAMVADMKGIVDEETMYRTKPGKGPSRRLKKKERKKSKIVTEL